MWSLFEVDTNDLVDVKHLDSLTPLESQPEKVGVEF